MTDSCEYANKDGCCDCCCDGCECCDWRKCDKCGGWDCQGCFTASELKAINREILLRAQINLISPMVSNSYIPEKKKAVELKVPRYLSYEIGTCLRDDFDEIIARDAEKLQREKENE